MDYNVFSDVIIKDAKIRSLIFKHVHEQTLVLLHNLDNEGKSIPTKYMIERIYRYNHIDQLHWMLKYRYIPLLLYKMKRGETLVVNEKAVRYLFALPSIYSTTLICNNNITTTTTKENDKSITRYIFDYLYCNHRHLFYNARDILNGAAILGDIEIFKILYNQTEPIKLEIDNSTLMVLQNSIQCGHLELAKYIDRECNPKQSVHWGYNYKVLGSAFDKNHNEVYDLFYGEEDDDDSDPDEVNQDIQKKKKLQKEMLTPDQYASIVDFYFLYTEDAYDLRQPLFPPNIYKQDKPQYLVPHYVVPLDFTMYLVSPTTTKLFMDRTDFSRYFSIKSIRQFLEIQLAMSEKEFNRLKPYSTTLPSRFLPLLYKHTLYNSGKSMDTIKENMDAKIGPMKKTSSEYQWFILEIFELAAQLEIECYRKHKSIKRDAAIGTLIATSATSNYPFQFLDYLLDFEKRWFFPNYIFNYVCEYGSMDQVRYTHSKIGTKVTYTDYNAMEIAAARGDIEMVKFLHTKRDEQCSRYIFCPRLIGENTCCALDYPEIVKYILAAKPTLVSNITSQELVKVGNIESMVHVFGLAIGKGHSHSHPRNFLPVVVNRNIVSNLLRKYSNKELCDLVRSLGNYSQTLINSSWLYYFLSEACRQVGHLPLVKYILETKSSVSTKIPSSNMNILDDALVYANYEVLDYLLEKLKQTQFSNSTLKAISRIGSVELFKIFDSHNSQTTSGVFEHNLISNGLMNGRNVLVMYAIDKMKKTVGQETTSLLQTCFPLRHLRHTIYTGRLDLVYYFLENMNPPYQFKCQLLYYALLYTQIELSNQLYRDIVKEKQQQTTIITEKQINSLIWNGKWWPIDFILKNGMVPVDMVNNEGFGLVHHQLCSVSYRLLEKYQLPLTYCVLDLYTELNREKRNPFYYKMQSEKVVHFITNQSSQVTNETPILKVFKNHVLLKKILFATHCENREYHSPGTFVNISVMMPSGCYDNKLIERFDRGDVLFPPSLVGAMVTVPNYSVIKKMMEKFPFQCKSKTLIIQCIGESNVGLLKLLMESSPYLLQVYPDLPLDSSRSLQYIYFNHPHVKFDSKEFLSSQTTLEIPFVKKFLPNQITNKVKVIAKDKFVDPFVPATGYAYTMLKKKMKKLHLKISCLPPFQTLNTSNTNGNVNQINNYNNFSDFDIKTTPFQNFNDTGLKYPRISKPSLPSVNHLLDSMNINSDGDDVYDEDKDYNDTPGIVDDDEEDYLQDFGDVDDEEHYDEYDEDEEEEEEEEEEDDDDDDDEEDDIDDDDNDVDDEFDLQDHLNLGSDGEFDEDEDEFNDYDDEYDEDEDEYDEEDEYSDEEYSDRENEYDLIATTSTSFPSLCETRYIYDVCPQAFISNSVNESLQSLNNREIFEFMVEMAGVLKITQYITDILEETDEFFRYMAENCEQLITKDNAEFPSDDYRKTKYLERWTSFTTSTNSLEAISSPGVLRSLFVNSEWELTRSNGLFVQLESRSVYYYKLFYYLYDLEYNIKPLLDRSSPYSHFTLELFKFIFYLHTPGQCNADNVITRSDITKFLKSGEKVAQDNEIIAFINTPYVQSVINPTNSPVELSKMHEHAALDFKLPTSILRLIGDTYTQKWLSKHDGIGKKIEGSLLKKLIKFKSKELDISLDTLLEEEGNVHKYLNKELMEDFILKFMDGSENVPKEIKIFYFEIAIQLRDSKLLTYLLETFPTYTLPKSIIDGLLSFSDPQSDHIFQILLDHATVLPADYLLIVGKWGDWNKFQMVKDSINKDPLKYMKLISECIRGSTRSEFVNYQFYLKLLDDWKQTNGSTPISSLYANTPIFKTSLSNSLAKGCIHVPSLKPYIELGFNRANLLTLFSSTIHYQRLDLVTELYSILHNQITPMDMYNILGNIDLNTLDPQFSQQISNLIHLPSGQQGQIKNRYKKKR